MHFGREKKGHGVRRLERDFRSLPSTRMRASYRRVPFAPGNVCDSPATTFLMPNWTAAPAHRKHGISVEYSVAPA